MNPFGSILSKLAFLIFGRTSRKEVFRLNRDLHGVYSTIAAVAVLFALIGAISGRWPITGLAVLFWMAWTGAFLKAIRRE